MNLKTLEGDLAADAKQFTSHLVADAKAEAAHIADPTQCGTIVRRHFNGLLFTLLAFTVVVIAVASMVFYLYTHR